LEHIDEATDTDTEDETNLGGSTAVDRPDEKKQQTDQARLEEIPKSGTGNGHSDSKPPERNILAFMKLDRPTGFKSVPSVTFETRQSKFDLSKFSGEKLPLFKLLLTKETLEGYPFHAYGGKLVGREAANGVEGDCTVYYETVDATLTHPLQQMWEVCRALDGKDVAPLVYFLSDGKEYKQLVIHEGIRPDEEILISDRFLVMEPLGERVIDRFAPSKIVSPEMVKTFLGVVYQIVNVIERMHACGYYASNLSKGSFFFRESDGKVVVGDLTAAEPAYYGKNDFKKDLSVVMELLNILDPDRIPFLDYEMLHDFEGLRVELGDNLYMMGRAKYHLVYETLWKYV
jgi:hypothetical protein